MSDKELLLETIQNDIKNIDKRIDMCIDEEGIDYLKSIQNEMRKQENEILKKMRKKEIETLKKKWLSQKH